MASGQLSREEALAWPGCRHACHVMLYCDTETQLFGRSPLKHIILMQMRFDGLLGFPGGYVNPSKETLEAGLTRELLEELGVAIPISEDDLFESRFARFPPRSSSSSSSSSSSASSSRSPSPSSSGLILHFYVKKVEEAQIREVEQAAVSTAKDYGQEVLGTVRVPLYTLHRRGGGLGPFLSHSFIGSARTQLLDAIVKLNMISQDELHRALKFSLEAHKQGTKDLHEALEGKKNWRERPRDAS